MTAPARPDFHVPCADPIIPTVPLVNSLRTACDTLLAWCQLMDCFHAMFLATQDQRPMTSEEMRYCYHTLRVLAAFFLDEHGRVRGAVPGIGSILGTLPPRSEPIAYTQYGTALSETTGPVTTASTGALPDFADMGTASMSNLPRSAERVNPSRLTPEQMWTLIHRHVMGASRSTVQERRRSIATAYTSTFDPITMARTTEILCNNALAGPSLYVMFPWVFGVRLPDGRVDVRGSFYAHVPEALAQTMGSLLRENAEMDACGLKLGALPDAFEEARAREIRNVLIVMAVFVAATFAANAILWRNAVRE